MSNDLKPCPERIWLIPDYFEGVYCYVWCDAPTPGIGQDPADSIEYIRVDAKPSEKPCREAFEEWWDKVDDYQYEDMSGAERAACAGFDAAWNRRSGEPIPYSKYRGALRMAIESKARLRSEIEQVRDEAKRAVLELKAGNEWEWDVVKALTRILTETEGE